MLMWLQKPDTNSPIDTIDKTVFDIAIDIEIDILINFFVIEVINVNFEHPEKSQHQHVLLMSDSFVGLG